MSSGKRSRSCTSEEVPKKRHRRSSNVSDTSSSMSSVPSSNGASEDEAIKSPTTPITPASPAVSTSAGKKTHHCPYEACNKSFNRPVRLEEHIRSHTNTRTFHCTHPPCTKSFLRSSHLAHHVKTAHTNIRDYVCDWDGCNKCFSTGTRLRRHISAHQGREKFRCSGFPPCNQTFRKHSTLQKHVDTDHLHRKPFRCSRFDEAAGQQCQHAYDSASRLATHVRKQHEAVLQYWCTDCLSTSSSSDLQMQGTPQGFASYSELQDHMRLAHPPICTTCGLACSTPRQLTRHIATMHSGQPLEDRKTLTCPDPNCTKTFTKRSNVNTHLRTVHAAVKPFVCGSTDLATSTDATLASWHAENACGASFTSKAGLQNHVRSQHIYARPAKPSALARLTGVSDHFNYMAHSPGKQQEQEEDQEQVQEPDEDTDALIACPLAPACAAEFVRYADVAKHAAVKHGIDAEAVADALAEREALSGGVFWLGGDNDDDDEDYVEPWRYEDDSGDLGGYIAETKEKVEFAGGQRGMEQIEDRPDRVLHEIGPAGQEEYTSLIDPVLRYIRPVELQQT